MHGDRAAGVGHNAGIVQTGDHARARQLLGAVTLQPPAAVPAPPNGLVGLPKPPAKTFIGREPQLEELARLVQAGAGVVAQAVHGLGGIGKTELALQHAYRHRARYRVVWWVLADSREAIDTGLAELAFRLHPDLRAIGATQTDAADWAVGWLAGHSDWLLVLDNVESRSDIELLLAQAGAGHVLITTRRDVGWQDITDGWLRLDVLTPTEAVALLLRLSGQTDTATAGVLAGELGCLPLALHQAGAYVRQTRTPLSAYLRRLRAEPARLLAVTAAGDDAQRAVARTWSITIDTIALADPLSLQLLQLLACYAPDAVPRDVLVPAGEPTAIDSALGILASYSMISLTERVITTHRLVQAITRYRLQQPEPGTRDHDPTAADPVARQRRCDNDRTEAPADRWPDTLRLAAKLLSKAAPPGDPGMATTGWPRWTALSPHVTALAEHSTNSIGGDNLAWLLGEAALFEASQGRYPAAVSFLRRALAITEAALRPRPPHRRHQA